MALNSDYQAFKNVVAARRSVYALNADLPVSEDDIVSVVKDLTELTPDALIRRALVPLLFLERRTGKSGMLSMMRSMGKLIVLKQMLLPLVPVLFSISLIAR